jgi:hypothetical protein
MTFPPVPVGDPWRTPRLLRNSRMSPSTTSGEEAALDVSQ